MIWKGKGFPLPLSSRSKVYSSKSLFKLQYPSTLPFLGSNYPVSSKSPSFLQYSLVYILSFTDFPTDSTLTPYFFLNKRASLDLQSGFLLNSKYPWKWVLCVSGQVSLATILYPVLPRVASTCPRTSSLVIGSLRSSVMTQVIRRYFALTLNYFCFLPLSGFYSIFCYDKI